MRVAVHAEWTKLRTVSGPAWLLLCIAVLTAAVSAGVAASMRCPTVGCSVDATKMSLSGVQLGQVIVAVLAALAVGTEYSTGLMGTTLTAMPRRLVTLAAKAIVVTGGVLVAGALACLGSVLAGRLILPGHGFTAAQGYPPLSLLDGPTLRATGGTVLYLALIGLLSLGIAFMVRDSATTVGVVLGVLYLFPLLAAAVNRPHWQRHLKQISPSSAGLSIQNTVGLHGLPLSPWAGLGVLALWAVGALTVGGLMLRWRDA